MEAFSRTNGLPEDSISGITQDKGWRIWIGSDNGMIWYNTGQFYAYDRKYGLSDSFVSAVYEDRDGNLWVGTHSGLNRFREGRFFNELKSEGAPYDRVNTIFEDREGNLWIGSIEGLIRLTPRRFFTYNKQQGLTHNNTVSVLEDRNGSLWTGTYGGGLNCLRDEQVIAYARADGLSHDLILALCEGRDGSLWIGTDIKWRALPLEGWGIQTLHCAGRVDRRRHQGDSRGPGRESLVGTSRGLSCLKEGKFTNYTGKEHLAGDVVRAFCEDHAGKLWLGTEGGLSRREERRCLSTSPPARGSPITRSPPCMRTPNTSCGSAPASGGLNRYRAGRFYGLHDAAGTVQRRDARNPGG